MCKVTLVDSVTVPGMSMQGPGPSYSGAPWWVVQAGLPTWHKHRDRIILLGLCQQRPYNANEANEWVRANPLLGEPWSQRWEPWARFNQMRPAKLVGAIMLPSGELWFGDIRDTVANPLPKLLLHPTTHRGNGTAHVITQLGCDWMIDRGLFPPGTTPPSLFDYRLVRREGQVVMRKIWH